MPPRDYGLARVRARRSRLLGRVGLEALLAIPGLDGRLEALGRTALAPAVARRSGEDPLAAAERGLQELDESELASLLGWFDGGGSRRALAAAPGVASAVGAAHDAAGAILAYCRVARDSRPEEDPISALYALDGDLEQVGRTRTVAALDVADVPSLQVVQAAISA